MRVIVSGGGCYNGISVFQGDSGGVAGVFSGGGGVLRRGLIGRGAFCEGVRGEMRVRRRTVYERRQSGGSDQIFRF